MYNLETLRTRLAFMGIDDKVRATLRDMRPLIAQALPEILDRFYVHITQFPEVARLFEKPEHMRHARDMQIRHWETITEAKFDEVYVTSVTRVGQTHNRLGLEPRWYIGGYSFLIAGLLQAIEQTSSSPGWLRRRSGPALKKTDMLTAITAAAHLDMDLAVSVYLESGLQAKGETLDRLGASFREVIDAVSSASTELEATAGGMMQTAETTQQLSSSVANASEEASSNVQSVASAAEELGASVSEVARQVEESSRIAQEAVSQAQRTDSRMSELAVAASRIGDVVKLITAIAEQTNLLALNATIEAARAGDAGRGFAVVAQEVKALAAQTAKATDEISTQIAGMQAATQESVGAIKEIGATIGRISEIAGAISVSMGEQNAATREIADNAQRTARGTANVAAHIVEVNRGAVETGAASSQVLDSARSLAGESARLRREVDNFLNTVRGA